MKLTRHLKIYKKILINFLGFLLDLFSYFVLKKMLLELGDQMGDLVHSVKLPGIKTKLLENKSIHLGE